MTQQFWEITTVGVLVVIVVGILVVGNVVKQDRLTNALNDAAKKPIELHQQLLSREDVGVKALGIVADLVRENGEQLAHMREVGVPVITRPVNGRDEAVVVRTAAVGK
jgi:hypothetical protein